MIRCMHGSQLLHCMVAQDGDDILYGWAGGSGNAEDNEWEVKITTV